MGPPLHLHHREDEWFYVARGRFVFEIDGKRTELGQGGSVLAPRGLSHCWANIGTEDAVMLLTLVPGGFETFFDEMSKAVAKGGPLPLDEIKAIYARHSMDWLGPRMFA
jgi:quercetin dioxygenase-like cupin family protein